MPNQETDFAPLESCGLKPTSKPIIVELEEPENQTAVAFYASAALCSIAALLVVVTGQTWEQLPLCACICFLSMGTLIERWR